MGMRMRDRRKEDERTPPEHLSVFWLAAKE